jgi:hypothetical protein
LTLSHSDPKIADRPAGVDSSIGELEVVRQIVEEIHLSVLDGSFAFEARASWALLGQADNVGDLRVVGDAPKD